VNMILLSTCSWINIPINQSDSTVYVKFRLTTRVWCFNISVIHLSDFRDKIWVGLGLGVGIRLSLCFGQ